MASRALVFWRTERSAQLDEIEAAHAAIGGVGRGRRTATQQINHAYAVLLCSHFQGFCRDLHSEAVDHLSQAIRPASLRSMLRSEMLHARKLDRGNANAGNIGHDFGRLGIPIWPAARARSTRTDARREKLDLAASWRNAIAHQDFTGEHVHAGGSLRVQVVRGWRTALDALSSTLDVVVADHLGGILDQRPW